MRKHDVIVVGGGIVGCAVAWYLAHFSLDVLLVEKGKDVCVGVSKANTGILHSRSYYVPGTLKGEMHLRSLSWFERAFRELDIHPLRCGALTLAFSKEEARYLSGLKKVGNIEGADILTPQEVMEKEPQVNPRIYAGYFDPQAMVVSPFTLTIALAEGAMLNGVEMVFEKEVTAFEPQGKAVKICCRDGTQYLGHFVVNCAGLYSSRLAQISGDRVPSLHLFRGQYFVLDRDCQGFIHHILYPVPHRESKGILVSPTPEGNLLLGPNFERVSGENTATTFKGLEEVWKGARKLVPELPFEKVIANFSGLRPTLPQRDFYIAFSPSMPHIVNAVGIESPGLTACFGIAEYIGELLQGKGLPLQERREFLPRVSLPAFRECTFKEREKLILEDPDWGKIVCRCEEVTLAEVKRALRSNPPARTLDGLKRRTRVMAGRCQGSFCGMHLPAILERECSIPLEKIVKSGPGSFYVLRRGEAKERAPVL